MRYFGRDRMAAIIREHVQMANEFAEWVNADADFEIAAPHPLALVCFRWNRSDKKNELLMHAINATGKAFLSHTVLNGRFVLRVAIGNVKVTLDDLAVTWQTIRECAAQIG
jgi:aromatic-L-amino-acid decarboxylase